MASGGCPARYVASLVRYGEDPKRGLTRIGDFPLMRLRFLAALIAVGTGYHVLAALAVSLTRFDGGVAFLWPASSLLIAALITWPRRRWRGALIACGIGSALATGLYGLGWAMALPFVVVNLTEALVAATLLRPLHRQQQPLGSSQWLLRFILAAGVAGPAAGSLLAAVAGTMAGLAPLPTFLKFVTGHALGNLAFIPLMMLIVDRHSARAMRLPAGRRADEAVILLLLVAATTAVSFWQDSMPLLFLPLMPVILATFRAGRVGAAIAVALVALIGGGLTLAGRGPIHLLDASLGQRVQFLQFYLATMVLTVLPVAADLKRRAVLHRKLRESEERYRMLAEHSSDILMQLRLDGRLAYVSPAIQRIGGYTPDDLVGRDVRSMISPDDLAKVEAAHAAILANPHESHSFDYQAVTADGSRRWFESRARALVDSDGTPFATLSVIRDISSRKEAEQLLTAAAMTDPLTGLPNRRAFRVQAERVLATDAARAGCIAIIDLDHFKKVNDMHGHDGGDAVLCQFAQQAQVILRKGDTVARLGGEEFALLLPGSSVEQALVTCERLRMAIAAMGVPSRTGLIRVTISAGVAELGCDGLDAAMKRADLALYQAKAGGRDQLALAA